MADLTTTQLKLRTTPTALELMPETEPPTQPQEDRFD